MEKFTAKTLEDLLNKAAEAKGVKVEELVSNAAAAAEAE
jgi:hypothetical protein